VAFPSLFPKFLNLNGISAFSPALKESPDGISEILISEPRTKTFLSSFRISSPVEFKREILKEFSPISAESRGILKVKFLLSRDST